LESSLIKKVPKKAPLQSPQQAEKRIAVRTENTIRMVFFIFLVKLHVKYIYIYNYVKSRFDLDFLEDATEVLRAIAHPIRIAIVDLLHENEKLSVTQIHEALDIEQAIASHHLRILKDKRVLRARRDGKNTFYSIKTNEVHDIIAALEQIV
jgi:ArsR family transcriptional regulator